MKRKAVGGLLVALAVIVGAPRGVAEPLQDIQVQLQQQGYTITEVRRTWLGRIRIEAKLGRYRREIVVDRVTGEVRRDLVEDTGVAPSSPRRQNLGEVIRRGVSRAAPSRTTHAGPPRRPDRRPRADHLQGRRPPAPIRTPRRAVAARRTPATATRATPATATSTGEATRATPATATRATPATATRATPATASTGGDTGSTGDSDTGDTGDSDTGGTGDSDTGDTGDSGDTGEHRR